MIVEFGRVDFRDERDVDEFLNKLADAFRQIRIDDQIIIGGGTPIKKHLSATKTHNWASVADGAQATTTVTCAGAALGDEVSCSMSVSLQGMQLTGYVSLADTITVVLRNATGGAVDLASATLRASVTQH